MNLWYYSKMGLQQGPVPEDELRQKIRRAEIGDSNLVWREGMAEWLPLSQVAELRESATPTMAATPPATGTPGPAFPPHSQQLGNVPLPQPPAYQGNYVAPAVPTYMWQSVLATALGLLGCWMLAMPFGIVAIVYAAKVEGLRVQGDIAGAVSASNSAKTWMILSFAMTGVALLGVIGILFSNA